MPHHRVCWERAGGCMIRGCGQEPPHSVSAKLQSPSTHTPPEKIADELVSEIEPQQATSDIAGRKLGVLVSCGPNHPNFEHSLRLAEAAMDAHLEVFFYCLDDAVTGVENDRLQSMRKAGMRLFACAYGAQQRKMPPSDNAIFGGLTMLSDMAYATDRFVSFN